MQADQVDRPRGSRTPAPVIEPGHTYSSGTDHISSIVRTRRTPLFWLIRFGIAFSLTMLLLLAVTWLFVRGISSSGVNMPVSWGFDVVNFVWWIGIGHAGSLISA